MLKYQQQSFHLLKCSRWFTLKSVLINMSPWEQLFKNKRNGTIDLKDTNIPHLSEMDQSERTEICYHYQFYDILLHFILHLVVRHSGVLNILCKWNWVDFSSCDYFAHVNLENETSLMLVPYFLTIFGIVESKRILFYFAEEKSGHLKVSIWLDYMCYLFQREWG